MRVMTPKETMNRYFETWNARDFDAFESLLADEVTFVGSLGTADGAAACRAGIERLSQALERVEVQAMVAEGRDVITWFHLIRQGEDPVPVANWSQVSDGKVQQARATFDPRPLLG